MTLGTTHWTWRPDVERVAILVDRHFSDVSCNTYRDHPWRGWDGRSIDVWAAAGRGVPLSEVGAQQVKRFVLALPQLPPVRHWIVEHTLWTSFGGFSTWWANDHTGRLRHFHITFW